ncbi:hypothetical protein GSI_14857 [Ganoderma sinense ZZ0214-1]|uniref:Uncharacterized protein n=1 Tax=Ganoderma sinense ZZ0214-1 TaxID=1077348 RepID=A0A2G8RPV3_9APHY|nr:hypothetical protein GSI_14857 [Ganoderma sinense ZZ0214-1]
MHLFPAQKELKPIVFQAGETCAIHVQCHQFTTTHSRCRPRGTRKRSSVPLRRRFILTIGLVGFDRVPKSGPTHSESPNASSSVNAGPTPSVRAPDSSTPPSPDTLDPMDHAHGDETPSMHARRHPPVLTSGLGLVRCAYAAKHFLRTGLRALTEWLGKEADYTCGQLVWYESDVGGA